MTQAHSSTRYKNGQVELRGKVWYLRYRDGSGGRTRERIGTLKDFPTKGAAERAAAGIRERINDLHAITIAPKTLSDVIARYKAEEMSSNYGTKKAYRNWFDNHIEPAFGHRPLQSIKAAELRMWLRSFSYENKDGKRVPMSDKSKKHARGAFSILFRFAMLWEWMPVSENPVSLFRLESTQRQVKRKRVLTPAEFGKLISHLEEPFRTMVWFCGALGLRCCEMIALQWQDIDWRQKTLTIARDSVNGHLGDVKTIKSSQPLPIADEVMELFTSMWEAAGRPDGDAWIFPSARMRGKKPLNAYKIQQDYLKPAADAAGVWEPGFGWHHLRHSYRAWLDRAGAPVGVQRDLMRHTDIRTTMNIYGDSFIDTMREAQGNVAKMLVQ